jgi:hypothetical protein
MLGRRGEAVLEAHRRARIRHGSSHQILAVIDRPTRNGGSEQQATRCTHGSIVASTAPTTPTAGRINVVMFASGKRPGRPQVG